MTMEGLTPWLISPAFPFHNPPAGWQRLFAPAQRIFYHWWRTPRRERHLHGPPIADLFDSASALTPVGA